MKSFFEKHRELLLVDHFDQNYVDKQYKKMEWLSSYYQLNVSGYEALNSEPKIYIVNHSSNAVADVLLLFISWRSLFKEIEMRGLVHQWTWSFRWLLSFLGVDLFKMGGLFAHPEVARKCLQDKKSLVIFPGGDIESARSFQDRYKVDLADRKGFAKLAKSEGVSIIPVVICGTHANYINTPITLGSKKFRIKKIALNLSLLFFLVCLLLGPWWLVGVSLLKLFIPIPSKVHMKFGQELSSQKISTLSIEEVFHETQNTMQKMMDELKSERRSPWH